MRVLSGCLVVLLAVASVGCSSDSSDRARDSEVAGEAGQSGGGSAGDGGGTAGDTTAGTGDEAGGSAGDDTGDSGGATTAEGGEDAGGTAGDDTGDSGGATAEGGEDAGGTAGDDTSGSGGATTAEGGEDAGGAAGSAGEAGSTGLDEGDYVEVVLPSDGGTVEAENGITIIVPEGAVSEDTNIQIRRLSTAEAFAILEPLGIDETDVLFGFEALPTGLEFEAPITVMDVGKEGLGGRFPIAHELDLEASSYTLIDTSVTSDPEAGEMGLEVSHFSAYATAAVKETVSEECEATPCRCGKITVKQSDRSGMCTTSTGDCSMASSKLSVQFHDCDGSPTESAKFEEIGAGCEATLALAPAASTVGPNESTAVTATATLACLPLAEQLVDINSSALGTTSPTRVETGADGLASTTFTAGDATGTATLTANATLSWYAYTITAGDEANYGKMNTQELSEEANVEIAEDVETYRVHVAISGTDFVDSPLENDPFGYVVNLASYQADCAFDVAFNPNAPEDVVFQYDTLGTCTQQLGEVTAASTGVITVLDGLHYTCFSADVQSINAPSSVAFKPCVVYSPTLRHALFSMIADPYDCETELGLGEFFSWVVRSVNGVTEQREYATEGTASSQSQVFSFQVNDDGSSGDDVLLEDGFTASGFVDIDVFLDQDATFVLDVTKLE